MARWQRSAGLVLAVACVSVFGVEQAPAAQRDKGHVVVANRASGSISVIEVKSDQVVSTLELPTGDHTPEPMYVVHHKNRVFVGDRGNDRIVVYRDRDFSLEATVPAGAGVFHMWAAPNGKQLWVANDIDATATVIDTRNLEVLATVPMPPDLVADGGVPHDILVAPPRENRAYVSMVGLSGSDDVVVQFDTQTFEELRRVFVGKDPHLSLTSRNDELYVPAQDDDSVTIFDRGDLSFLARIDVEAAHGAGMRRDGRVFYTTNIAGGGPMGLIAIDTASHAVLAIVEHTAADPAQHRTDAPGPEALRHPLGRNRRPSLGVRDSTRGSDADTDRHGDRGTEPLRLGLRSLNGRRGRRRAVIPCAESPRSRSREACRRRRA